MVLFSFNTINYEAKQFNRHTEKLCVTKGDVKHVIEALVEEVQENLANGNKVKLNQFSTFYMTFCCPGVATSAECTVKNIKRVNIRFVPIRS